MNDDQAMTQLPRWKCHKEVWAAKIMGIERGSEGARLRLTFGKTDSLGGYVESAYSDMDLAWIGKHDPQVGGYFVQYADGYKSYSPAAAFEGGYTRVGG